MPGVAPHTTATIVGCVAVLAGCFEAPKAPEAWGDAGSDPVSDTQSATATPDGTVDVTDPTPPVEDVALVPDATSDGEQPGDVVDVSDPESDGMATDTADGGEEPPPLCPGPEPCDLHCFILVQWGDANTFKAMMCKERLGALPEEASAFISSHCADSLPTTTEPTGGALGACPVEADLAPAGWKPMRQVAGCRVDYDEEASFTKWFYGLAIAEQDFKVGRGAPSQGDVEEECAALSQSGSEFATVIHCEPSCEEGAECPPQLCTDRDHDTCSTRTCAGSTEDETTLCGWAVDHAPCGDGKACTDNACVAGLGCVDNPVHEACEMACKVGTCEGAQPGTDEQGCTYVDAEDGSSCDDGDLCTEGDACLAGGCVAGTPIACEELDSDCTVGVCTNGICVGSIANAGGACDEGVGCYDTYQCNGGACVGAGSEIDCNDGNPCTIDACEGTGCLHAPAVATPCDDGNACTQSDRCGEDGACQGVLNCDDGDPCTMDTCVGDVCSHEENPLCSCCSEHPSHEMCEAGPTKTCVCEQDSTCCDGEWTAECVELAGLCEGCGACGDGSCDPGESFGSCPDDCLPLCESALDCDDWIACTAESCDGACTNDTAPMEGESCNDWDPCTATSACVTGTCVGSAVDTPTCTGNCPAQAVETLSLTQTARAAAVHFLNPVGNSGITPTQGVLFVAEDLGLRRFYFDLSGPPSGHYMEEAGKLVPWSTPGVPVDFVISGHDPSYAFVAGAVGIETFYVGAYQSPAPLGEYPTMSPPRAFVESVDHDRLIVVTELGFEVIYTAGDGLASTGQVGEALDSVGTPMMALVDIALHGEWICLLDEEGGLVIYAGEAIESADPLGQFPTAEFFESATADMRPSAMVSSGSSVYVLSESYGPLVEYQLTRLLIDTQGQPTLEWTLPIKEAEVTDMAAGPCNGLTFGLGEGGIGWLPLPEDDEKPPTDIALTTTNVDFPVQGVAPADLCGSDGTGVAWAALAGPASGIVVRDFIQEAGVLNAFEPLAQLARTGRATSVALYDTLSDDQTLAYVADGEGLRVGNSVEQHHKRGLHVFDVTDPMAPVRLKRCTFGDGASRVTEVIHDGHGHVVTLVAEGEASQLVMLVPGWSGEPFNPCYAQEDCKVPLYPAGMPELWMEPHGVIAFDRIEETLDEWKRWNRFVVIGEGPSVLQIADMSMHSVLPNVFNAFTLESFPDGTTGLSVIAGGRDGADVMYLGTTGSADLLLLIDVTELWPSAPDFVPAVGQALPTTGTLSPVGEVGVARPVAMTLGDDDLLYVLLDDPDELAKTSSCGEQDGDCQEGLLWIVDVSEPSDPSQIYLGGLSATGTAGDLGNAGDLEVVGAQLYITSHSRGLIVADVSAPGAPVVIEEQAVAGEASGLALGPDAVFVASGRTPLSVVRTACEDDN